jgi:hypothetical protein
MGYFVSLIVFEFNDIKLTVNRFMRTIEIVDEYYRGLNKK